MNTSPTFEDRLSTIQIWPHRIEYIANPVKELQLAAVKKDGNTIQYIYKRGIVPSEEVQLAAVKQNGLALKYIPNPSKAVQFAAINQNTDAHIFIPKPEPVTAETYKKFEEYCKQYNFSPPGCINSQKLKVLKSSPPPKNISHIKEINAIKKNPELLRSVVQSYYPKPLRSQKRARSATRGFTPKPEIRYIDHETGRVVSTWHKLSPIAEETVKDIQAQVNPKCAEYKELMNILPFNKKTNKKLGSGAFGVAYQTISTSTLKQKLNQDFGGIDNIVIKFQNLDADVEDDDCVVKEIKNKAYTTGSTVCKDTSELIIHTSLVNSLCEPHNSNPFSVCFFKMFTYEVCGKQIISLTPLLAGGTLDKIPINTPRKQVNFDLINIAFALTILNKTRTMHNDLKPDNIFLDDITSYEKCISKNIVYSLSTSSGSAAATPTLFPVFYLEYGNKRLYFKSEGLKYIPKIGDWGMACSYDKKIFNKKLINGEFGTHSPDFYSPSSDFMFLLQCFCYYEDHYSLYRGNKLIKYLYSILRDILLLKKTDIENSVTFFPVSFDHKGFNKILKKNNVNDRIGYQQLHTIDKVLQNGLPELFLNCLLNFDTDTLQNLGVYTNIPAGYTQQDCVCIGRNREEHFKEYSIVATKKDRNLIDTMIDKNTNLFSEILSTNTGNTSVIDAKNTVGETALYHAIINNDVVNAQLLINNGANVNKKLNKLDTSYLLLAVELGLQDMTRLLLKNGANVNFQRKTDGISPLMLAVLRGDIFIAELLLRSGAKVDLVDSDGYNALVLTITTGKNNDDIINLLIRYGSDINIKDNEGENVLITTVQYGYIEQIKKIIAFGGDVNSFDDSKNSVLIYAVKSDKVNIVKLLIEHGANVQHKNIEGHDALFYSKNQQITEMLQQALSTASTASTSKAKNLNTTSNITGGSTKSAKSAKSTTTPFWKQVMGF